MPRSHGVNTACPPLTYLHRFPVNRLACAVSAVLICQGVHAEDQQARHSESKPQAASPVSEVTTLPVIEVVEKREAEYAISNTSVATKTDTPLLQTPMTVEVLPAQVLQEQGLTGAPLAAAAAYLGVQTLGMRDAGDYLIFRGFTSPTTLWNGFRIEDATPGINYANGGAWMNNVDRLEVLKGPASILYGRTEPGGAVNLVTRKPQAEFQGEMVADAGSWSGYGLGVDLTGPLNQDKSLLYRITLADDRGDSWFRHGADSRSLGIAPALEWRMSPRTTLSFEGQYRRHEGGANAQQYIPIDPGTGQALTLAPKDTLLPGNLSKYRQNRTAISLEHRFNDDWSLTWKAMHNDANNPYSRNVLAWNFNFPIAGGALMADLMVFENESRQITDATLFDLTGHVTALGIKHTLLFGMDYYRKRFDQTGGADFSQSTDYFNPSAPPPVAYTDFWNIKNREYALYFQDQMALPADWHLLIGGRYQTFNEHSVSNTPSLGGGLQDIPYETNVFLPRVGLLWQIQPDASVYYSYGENMGSSNGLDVTGSPIKPERSKQHELGLKATWLGGRLNGQMAVFSLTKYNVASDDPANPGFNIGVGEVRSTGYEAHLQGAITKRWNVLANYSYARPYVVVGASGAAALQPQTIVAGELLPYVSNQTFALWTSYKLPGQGLTGWTVGGGVNWASAANPANGTTIATKPYTISSAFATYETSLSGHKTQLQLNINNLFDKEYLTYQTDDGVSLIGAWGAPRQVKLSMRMEF